MNQDSIIKRQRQSHVLVINTAKLFLFPLLVFVGHVFMSRVLHLYDIFPWIDVPAHFLGGVAIAYSLDAIIVYWQSEKIVSEIDDFVYLMLLFCMVATVAVFWEFAEFALDQTFGTNVQISLSNTMKDMFVGIIGGLIITIYIGVTRGYIRRITGKIAN